MRLIGGLIAGLLLAIASAHSENYRAGVIEVQNPWARATPKGAGVGGGYARISNAGSSADRLVGGEIDGAARIEVHTMAVENGVMRMRPVAQGLEIKPGESVELRPGSYHLMFMDLKRPLTTGERRKGTLIFQNAGRVDVEFNVQPIGGAPAPAHSGAGHH
jgi:periplasmic copper chaperone A